MKNINKVGISARKDWREESFTPYTYIGFLRLGW